MKIGIIGHGFVGKAVEYGFKDKCEIAIYDPKYKQEIDSSILLSDFIFVCVPTSMKKNGTFERKIIDNVMKTIYDIFNHCDCTPPVIIKSTVLPRIIEEYIKKYTKIDIVTNPEFLTERHANEDFVNFPLRLIGSDSYSIGHDVEHLYRVGSICDDKIKTFHVNPSTAMFYKYMANCFGAMKITFMNDFARYFNTLDNYEGWEAVRDIMRFDKRFSDEHTKVPGPDGNYGWGGKCFPKDMNAIRKEMGKTILDDVWKRNLYHRSLKNE